MKTFLEIDPGDGGTTPWTAKCSWTGHLKTVQMVAFVWRELHLSLNKNPNFNPAGDDS